MILDTIPCVNFLFLPNIATISYLITLTNTNTATIIPTEQYIPKK